MLEIVAQGHGKYIVKITDGFYFYGDGELGSSLFGWHPDLFLRFDPYMYDPVDGMVIPDKVLDFIEKYADICAEGVEWVGQCDPLEPELYKQSEAYRLSTGELDYSEEAERRLYEEWLAQQKDEEDSDEGSGND